MPKVTIDIPEKCHFETTINVRITDLNYGNHVGTDNMVSLIHEARFRLFASLGYSEMEIEGTRILVSDLVVLYKAESFYGDVLKFEISVCGFDKYGCEIFYRITDLKNNKPIANAKTGVVFKDKTTEKLTIPPEKFISMFS